MIPCSGEDMLHFPQVVGEGGGLTVRTAVVVVAVV